MTSDRPYRRAMPVQEAIEEITRCSGRHFDPEVVEPFLIMADEFLTPAPDHEAPFRASVG